MGVVANLVIRVSASVSDFEKQLAGMEKTLGRTGAKLQSIGGDLTKGITLPLAGIAIASVKMSTDFETAMTKVRTLASESEANIKLLRQSVLDLAPTVGIGPTALADALLVIESTGFRGADAMGILEMAAKGSAVGLGDTKDVARALTAAINAYGIENLSAAQAADVLFATIDAGGAEATELAGELGRVVGLASQMGVSFQEVGAFIATYTRLGLSAAEATTALSGVMNTLLSPSKEARDALAGIGLSAEGLRQAVKERGLTEALIALQERLHGNADATAAVFGNVRALAGVMGTAGAQADTYRKVLGQISNSADILNERFAIWRTTTAATWREFTAQVQVAGIQLGEQLAPAFSKLLQAAAPVLDKIVQLIGWFGEHPTVSQFAIATLAVGAALGPIAFAVGTIMKVASGLIAFLRMAGSIMPVAGAAAAWRTFWIAATGPWGLAAAAVGTAAVAGPKIAELIKNGQGPFGLPAGDATTFMASAGLPGSPLRNPMRGPAGIGADEASAFMAAGGGGGNILGGGGGGIDEAAAKKRRQQFEERIAALAAVNQPIFDAIAKRDQELLSGQFELHKLETNQLTSGGSNLLRPTTELLRDQLNELETTIIPGFKLGEAVAVAMTPPPSLLKSAFTNSLAGLPQTIMAALTGGGNVGKSVGGLIGGNIVGTLGQKLAKPLTEMFGQTLGAALGAALPGVGTLIGSSIGPIMSGIKKGITSQNAAIRALTGGLLLGPVGAIAAGIFGGRGPTKEELEGRATATQFREQVESMLTDSQRLSVGADKWALSLVGVQDAYLATGRTAAQATTDMHRLWEAEKLGADAVKKVIDEINLAFQEQAADTERLNAAIKTYGFSIEELGPKFRQQQLTDQAKELIEDWRVLVASGIDLSVVNTHMADTFNQYLSTALKAGVEVPGALRPILESLANQGVLLDGNGNKITDLGAAGIVFSETMTQGFDRVVMKLQQLIDTLQGTGIAINDLPTSYTLDVQMRNLDQVNAQIQQLQSSMSLWDRITQSNPELDNLIAQRDALTQQIAAGQLASGSDVTGTAPTGPPVVIQAGTIIGNVDDLAVAVGESVSEGGDSFSIWRRVTQQLAGA